MARADLRIVKGDSTDRGSKEWASRLRVETKSLATKIDEQYIELAERLWWIYDTPIDNDRTKGPIYTAWGYSSFADYVETDLEMHKKRAQRLVRIWYKLGLQLADIDQAVRQRIIKLGFSKVRELVGVLTPRNAEAWAKKGEELSYLKLCKAIERYRAERDLRDAQKAQEEELNGSSPLASAAPPTGDEDPDEKEGDEEPPVPDMKPEDLSHKNFALYPDQLETVELALKRAAELSNSSKRSHNLSLICLDFLSTNTFATADETQRLRFLQKFEKLLGYKLIVVDPDAEEVVYGINTLEKLAHRRED